MDGGTIVLAIWIAALVLGVAIRIIIDIRRQRNASVDKKSIIYNYVTQQIPTFCFCVLCVLSIFLLMDISDLKKDIYSLEQQMQTQYNQLVAEISNLNEKITDQSNIAKEYGYSFQNIDTEHKTAELHFDVTLKDYNLSSTVSISLGDKETALQENNGIFSGYITVGLFDSYESFPLLTVNTNGVAQSQVLENCPYESFYTCILPSHDISLERHEIVFGDEMKITGSMDIFEKPAKYDGIPIKSVAVAFEVDGKTIKETPISLTNGTIKNFDISGTYNVKNSSTLYICIKSITESGWTITERVAACDKDNSDLWEIGIGVTSITDKNGTELINDPHNVIENK